MHGVHFPEENLVFLERQKPGVFQLVEEVDRVFLAPDPQIVVDILEQLVGAIVHDPPKVLGELLERMQPLGQLALDHQPAQGRRVGNQLLLDEVDLFVESAASVVYGAVCPRVHPVERLIVGPVVELDQIFPQRDFRYSSAEAR